MLRLWVLLAVLATGILLLHFKERKHWKLFSVLSLILLFVFALWPYEKLPCSMHHTESFDRWWMKYGDEYERHNITKKQFSTFPFPNGFHSGDGIQIPGLDYEIGDVVIAWNGRLLHHRLLGTRIIDGKSTFITKGDFNNFEDDPTTLILGKMVQNPFAPLMHYVLRPYDCAFKPMPSYIEVYRHDHSYIFDA